MFQSAPPAWGAISVHMAAFNQRGCFNPRPPRGGRSAKTKGELYRREFQSAPPAWGAMTSVLFVRGQAQFQSAPPAWGAIAHWVYCLGRSRFQSAPPAWGAIKLIKQGEMKKDVSIRAPRVGGDTRAFRAINLAACFNPRPPRGGRSVIFFTLQAMFSFNPRPPRGGRLCHYSGLACSCPFQSAPPAWGAICHFFCLAYNCPFQSAPPAWGAIAWSKAVQTYALVSIRAPRVGGDRTSTSTTLGQRGFNPRPPRGGRWF